MLKFIVVAAVVAFAVGIIVGVNSKSGSTSRVEQVLSNVTPVSSDVPQLDASDPRRMTNAAAIEAEITLLNLLENAISERNAEYQVLTSELGRLLLAKTTLEDEREGTELVSAATSGQ